MNLGGIANVGQIKQIQPNRDTSLELRRFLRYTFSETGPGKVAARLPVRRPAPTGPDAHPLIQAPYAPRPSSGPAWGRSVRVPRDNARPALHRRRKTPPDIQKPALCFDFRLRIGGRRAMAFN